MDELTQLLAVNGYLPHGYCLSWSPTLVASYVLSDVLIFLSYFSMPVALGYFASKRMDFPYRWLLWLFSAFIMACGTTHLMGAIVLWQPMYALDAFLKVVTALISVVTAVVLWPLIPKALKLPSPAQLRLANLALQSEIVERKRVEEALRVANAAAEDNLQKKALLMAAIVNSCDEGIVSKTLDGTITTWNHAAERIFGYGAEEMIGHSMARLLPPGREHEEASFLESGGQGNATKQFETERIRKDGARIDVSVTVSPILGLNDQVIGVSVVVRDITERKRSQDALQQSLKDKQALLKEVHHRVKNNLQVIISLLRLEGGRSSHLDTKAVLDEMQGRIRSMALLHESLYRSGTFASVDLGAYLGQLATQVFKTQVLHPDKVQLKLQMASVQVGMDQAISSGLLVNELISNCLKHGFPQGRSGQIVVELKPEGASGMWRLGVSDTGVGVTHDFESRRQTSLGLQLADDMSQQIGGQLVIESTAEQGTTVEVVFQPLAPVKLIMPS